MYALGFLMDGGENPNKENVTTMNVVIDFYLVLVVIVHSPIVFLQLYSQVRKICRKNPIPDPNYIDEHTTT